MKILLIGSSGTIGAFLFEKLAEKHELIGASRNDPQNPVDMEDERSIQALFEKVGKFDSLICCAGEAKWADLQTLTHEDFLVGFKSKLLGQINLARLAIDHIQIPGSITLTSGVLADRPVDGSSIASTINGGLHSFVLSASREINSDIRINAVCPGLVEESYEKYKEFFPGHKPISMERLLGGYKEALEGNMTGEVIRIY